MLQSATEGHRPRRKKKNPDPGCCPTCDERLVEDECPACQRTAHQKKCEAARRDRRAEFYDVQANLLSVRLLFVDGRWASCVEYQPKGQDAQVGMRVDHGREEGVERFRELVHQVIAAGGWKAVTNGLWDLRVVNPLMVDDIDI